MIYSLNCSFFHLLDGTRQTPPSGFKLTSAAPTAINSCCWTLSKEETRAAGCSRGSCPAGRRGGSRPPQGCTLEGVGDVTAELLLDETHTVSTVSHLLGCSALWESWFVLVLSLNAACEAACANGSSLRVEMRFISAKTETLKTTGGAPFVSIIAFSDVRSF